MKKIIYILGIIVTIALGMYFGSKYPRNNQKKDTATKKQMEVPKIAEKDTDSALRFAVKDASGNLEIPLKNGVKFKKSSIHFSESISKELDNNMDKLKNYLSEQDEQSLYITSFYSSDEVNSSIFPNIGYARAVSFKNYAFKKGIPTKLMDLNGVLNDSMEVDENDNIKKPLKLNVGKSKDYSEVLKKIIEDIESNPLVVHFATAKSSMDLSNEQRRKVVNMSTYLDKVEESFCQITGHTDNRGSNASNITLGNKRAAFVKQYFTRSGIQENKINIVSKGEEEPIAENTTEKGRAKNRRATVKVK